MTNNDANLLIKGNSYERITFDEAKKAGYVGSEHLDKRPEGTIAYHVQSGYYWTLED